MRRASKNQLMTVMKEKIMESAQKLINELTDSPVDGSDYDRWRESMTWKYGYKDNPNEMLNAVESYSKYLMQRVKEVRDLQIAHDEMKAVPEDE